MAKTKTINIEPIKESVMRIRIVGDTDLMLNCRGRYYVQS